MSENEAIFVDISGARPKSLDLFQPIVIKKATIEERIGELIDQPVPDNGRREFLIRHPLARGPGQGLAPGIRVTLSVLLPGETTAPIRQNSTAVEFCIAGSGRLKTGNKDIAMRQYDVCNMPSWVPHSFSNDGNVPFVRLSYSNSGLLDMLHINVREDLESLLQSDLAFEDEHEQDDPTRQSPYGTFEMGTEGAMLMPYEILINPPSIKSPLLHWPWQDVKIELDKLTALGKTYIGRRLYLLFNPMTGRTNGTTPNFFATMTVRPPKIVDRPHRHISAAINYYFSGSGRSTVEGQTYEWEAGDLMLSAPGWAVHNHASYDEPVYELTVQDQPLNILMESLLWQETLKRPPALLGPQPGFETNRNKAA